MILPLRVLGRRSAKRTSAGRAMVPIVTATCSMRATAQLARRDLAGAERHEGDDGFAFDVVGARDYCCFGYCGMAYQSAFDFHGAEAMAGDFDYIVHAA